MTPRVQCILFNNKLKFYFWKNLIQQTLLQKRMELIPPPSRLDLVRKILRKGGIKQDMVCKILLYAVKYPMQQVMIFSAKRGDYEKSPHRLNIRKHNSTDSSIHLHFILMASNYNIQQVALPTTGALAQCRSSNRCHQRIWIWWKQSMKRNFPWSNNFNLDSWSAARNTSLAQNIQRRTIIVICDILRRILNLY